jgi:hypothetical protein
MKSDTIKIDILNASNSLLTIARDLTHNSISDNFVFIIRIVDKDFNKISSFYERNKLRNIINNSKPVLTIDNATKELENIFDQIHEINLYIYKSENIKTIIEIEVTIFDKSISPKKEIPQLHCKVPIPPYASQTNEKFDINWQLETFGSKWKMFWWKQKTKRELNKIKNVP